MQLKTPTTFEEQLSLIREKGFVISKEEEPECVEFLRRTNYYRLSAYFLPFRNDKGEVFAGIPFSRVQKIYEFDSLLRRLVFSVIEDIEINLRTQLAYYTAHKYGALGYESDEMFSARQNKEKYKRNLKRCVEDHKITPVVMHHNEKYDGKFPVWVIIEFFSMGMLSYFYKDMYTADQKKISAQFHASCKELES